MSSSLSAGGDRYAQLGRLFANFLDQGMAIYRGGGPTDLGEPVVVTGASIGLPGGEKVFADDNFDRILHGKTFIDVIPVGLRRAMADKKITRLVKSDKGGPRFETIDSPSDVIKLAGRGGHIGLSTDFGIAEERAAAMDSTTRMAIAAGVEALRDAGIPLVMHYKTTSKGTALPERWGLPERMQDETGVIFGSAFPGSDTFAQELRRYFENEARQKLLEELQSLRARLATNGDAVELDRRIEELESDLRRNPYAFDRRFLFRALSMGHSQLAEYIGARGPNTQINSACASGTQAVALAEDWIARGRCRRVVIVTADNVTSDHLLEWIGAGFLASGAAATDEVLEEAALPFDRRRHGLLLGMGASGMVIESAEAARERGIRPIVEVLGTVTANSAYHGSRLNIEHIRGLMEKLIADCEARHGIDRAEIARQTVFVSHETYTPARGGSAQAEISALRSVFGANADDIVIANTKGMTGHAMGAGVEDAAAVKILETGLVPPVANFKEVDPELGSLNLSKGGSYPVHYALRLGAGFGSQISLSLSRLVPSPDGHRPAPRDLGYATRIDDRARFEHWIAEATGYRSPELEVVNRTLRVKAQGPGISAGVAAAAPEAVSAAVARPVPVTETVAASAPVAASASVTASTSVTASAPASDPIAEKVLSIVAAQTGYPPDMLDVELDLEADLGIDTVKQAETFAAVREAYDIPREDNLELRAFPTLGHVIQFVRDRRPDLAQVAAPVAAAAPATVPATVPVSAPAHSGASDPIADKVLDVVAGVTGYPPEMLELDLDLEADLGIDTVKQAETFAAVREAYGIPRDETLELRDFPTLNHVIAWVRESLPDAAPPRSVEVEPKASSSAEPAPAEETGSLRRVPVPVLRPPLSVCKPSGVELVEGSRVVVMVDRRGVAKALLKELRKRGVEVLAIEDAPTAEELSARLEAWVGEGPVRGVYWLTALDREDPIEKLSPDDWAEAVRVRAKLLYTTMRALYEQISAPGTFLISATRLGGQHGFDETGAVAPLGGAVTGFTKTYKREKPEATVKAVDFEAKCKAATVAERLIAETLWDPGACEVGYTRDDRWAITASVEPLKAERPLPLKKESVFAVTGAAGSIVSAIVGDLAKASGATFHLLDLTPEPDAKDPDLQRFAADRDGLQRDLFERLKQTGQKATPVVVQRLLADLERKHAALRAIEAVRTAGGNVYYHSVNLLDKEAVAAAVEKIREVSGGIDVLIHAAGLEISHFLPDKKPSEFDLVFDVKANGWYHLLSSIGDMPLGAAVVFSSIAGRFGNGGQTDYSAANELLAKSVSSFRNARPQTRGLAVDWTAWADIGMASRGSIPKMMEMAGIDMLKPSDGIPVVRNELETGTRGEVVIGGALGILMEEWDENGGIDPSKLESARYGLMHGNTISMGVHSGLRVETTLDPKEQPFLYDHKIAGTPVLPGVMGIEGFGELTKVLFPDWHISAIEQVDFLAPFKFYRDEPRTLTLTAHLSMDGDDVVAACQLVGARSIMGRTEQKTHFTASVRLARKPVEEDASSAPPPLEGKAVEHEDIYQVYFHGPAYQVIDTAWRNDGMVVGRMSAQLPDDHRPAELRLVTEPRLVELCFQTAGVWQIGTTGRMGLPHHIDQVKIVRSADHVEGRLHAIVTPKEGGKSYDAHVADEAGNLYVVLQGYRTAELPDEVDPGKRKPLRAAMD
ncbi:MAG: SDR family NAD(P)-dependent oxidoreductase [Polyangiales bacterium]